MNFKIKKLGIIASVAFLALAMTILFVYKNFFSRVEVFASGKSLGVYASVHKFNEAIDNYKSKYEDRYGVYLIKAKYEFNSSDEELRNTISEDAFDIDAYAILKNGRSIYALKNEDAANEFLTDLENHYYSDNTMSVKIKDDVEIKREKMSLRAVKTVKAALEEVLENNKLKNEKAINVLLTKKENVEEVITMPVESQDDPSLPRGETVLSMDGEDGLKSVKSISYYENDELISKVVLEENVKKKAAPKLVLVGTRKALADGSFIKPTRGGYSSGFGRRWGRMHQGVDIDADYGDDVFSADGGVVSFAGTLGTYGNLIEIDHQNGYKTRYAHLSSINVSKGDTLTKGEFIGKVGATGRVTGPHLHFEVIVNGKAQDPMNYLRGN
ncbi:MAG: peptidoglycan DD-metalloendopeptidase family protein [Fenollaria massiliensis]